MLRLTHRDKISIELSDISINIIFFYKAKNFLFILVQFSRGNNMLIFLNICHYNIYTSLIIYIYIYISSEFVSTIEN